MRCNNGSLGDPHCSCDCIKHRCAADVHAHHCLRAEPFLGTPEDPLYHTRVEELVSAPVRPVGAGCIWDDTAVLLKASVYSDERALIMGWVLAWLRGVRAARTCHPRLHVVSDLPEEVSAFRGLLRRVPNVSFHTLRPPFEMDPFYAIQWPMVWADNWTSARHVLVLDTDSPPVLPLRCRALFDANERPFWRSWHSKGLRWVSTSDGLFDGLGRAAAAPSAAPALRRFRLLRGNATAAGRGLDFMTFFPVVVPTALLPLLRKAVLL